MHIKKVPLSPKCLTGPVLLTTAKIHSLSIAKNASVMVAGIMGRIFITKLNRTTSQPLNFLCLTNSIHLVNITADGKLYQSKIIPYNN